MDNYDVLKKAIELNPATFFWEFDIDNSKRKDFEKWFYKKAEFLGKICELPNDIKISQDTSAQCFHNSQLVAIENDDVKYYEGYVFGPKYRKYIHHGFNYCNKGPFDVTYLRNKTQFHEELGDQHLVYYGVHIPSDFINNYKDRISNSNQHNPILLDYYNSNK